MKVIGITATSPYDIKAYMEQFKEEQPPERQKKLRFQFLGFNEEIKENSTVLLCPSVDVFKQNINNIGKQCVVVFDSPMLLETALIPVVDAISKDGVRWFLNHLDYEHFRVEFVKLLRGEYKVNPDMSAKLIPNLLQRVKGSLTSMLLNLTMKSRVPEKRRAITFSYIVWLLSGESLQSLQNRMERLGLDDEAIAKLVEWFNTEDGQQARKIFVTIKDKQVEGKAINYDALCKGTSVEPFDVKYLLKHVRSLGTLNKLDSTSVEEYAKRQELRKSAPTNDAADDMIERSAEPTLNDLLNLSLEELAKYEKATN